MGGGRGGEESLARGEIFELLSNERRRGVIHYLERADGSVSLDELVDAVVAWEYGSGSSRASVYSALVQTHLPRLEQAEVLEYDPGRNAVHPTERLDEVQLFLEYSPRHDIPWAEYYLGLSGVAAALVIVVWLGVPPFDQLSEILVAALIVSVLVVSSVVHVLQRRRWFLGRESLPRDWSF